MITYELAKKLKESGFSQELENGDWGYCVDCGENSEIHLAHHDNDEGNFVGNDYSHHLGEKWKNSGHNTLIKIPTLSELIEACGDRFNNLNRMKNEEQQIFWVCNAFWEIGNNKVIWELRGDTPEEVVAKLWLKINKK